MPVKEAYIVIDFGTGNLRAAVMDTAGEVLGVAREDIVYFRDEHYEDSIYFKPQEVWQRIAALSSAALEQAGAVTVLACTATSQREGIVVLDDRGNSIVGLPNIDHRGRKWESVLTDKNHVYQLTGRYPTSLFSALKIVGLREGNSEWWDSFHTFLSISDWVEYMFSGIVHYEHSQASETLLYDVAGKCWSAELCALFDIPEQALPVLKESGTVLGTIQPAQAELFGINMDAKIVVGGADTQLAVLSTGAENDDMVIISGTTTPIIKLVNNYVRDEHQRTWTGRHVTEKEFMIEANAGVTGLNYQRLKKIFYPNEDYAVIEKELATLKDYQCIASLGSLVADEKEPLIKGGFIFNTPVNHELSRASFVWATLWDIACSIKENYNSLSAVTPNDKNHIWTCGGGMESKMLRQFIADLTGKEIRIRKNYRHASAVGGVMICNRALAKTQLRNDNMEVITPQQDKQESEFYSRWKENRQLLKKIF